MGNPRNASFDLGEVAAAIQAMADTCGVRAPSIGIMPRPCKLPGAWPAMDASGQTSF
jgi:hypothetical protein